MVNGTPTTAIIVSDSGCENSVVRARHPEVYLVRTQEVPDSSDLDREPLSCSAVSRAIVALEPVLDGGGPKR